MSKIVRSNFRFDSSSEEASIQRGLLSATGVVIFISDRETRETNKDEKIIIRFARGRGAKHEE
jgi:hypothetical protein